MIGEVEFGGAVLKLSARAIVRIERKTGLGIDKALAELEQIDRGFSFVKFLELFGAIMNGGKGADEEEALDFLDGVSLEAAVEAFQKTAEAAFPSAVAEDPAPGKKG